MSKSSQYSISEREKWLRMWNPLARFLDRGRYPFLLDITFHKELKSLPDNLLEQELIPKLRLVAIPAVLVDNTTWTVSLRFIEMDEVRQRQKGMLLKLGSPLLIQVITGRYDSAKGCTHVLSSQPAPDNLSYVEDVEFAAGAIWYCDATQAIRRKARHIKAHLAEAVDQLPDDEPGVVHVGLESHDGGIIEVARLDRIKDEIRDFDPRGKLLTYVYVHTFDPRVTPEKPWDFGESVAWLSRIGAGHEPLEHPMLVLPESVTHQT
jgi:hypothetical protein